MRSKSITVAWGLATLIAGASPAGAVTNGDPDGASHPYVAFIVGTTTAAPCAGNPAVGCTAVLIAPDVLVTSSSCADEFLGVLGSFISDVWVSFDQNAPTDCTSFHHVRTGGLIANPDTSIGRAELGVLLLDEPVEGIMPAELTVQGRLEALPREQAFVAAAYGRLETEAPAQEIRRSAPVKTLAVTSGEHIVSFLVESGPPLACAIHYTDGGGIFVDGTSEVVSLVHVTLGICKPTNIFQRLDDERARAFLGGFVVLP